MSLQVAEKKAGAPILRVKKTKRLSKYINGDYQALSLIPEKIISDLQKDKANSTKKHTKKTEERDNKQSLKENASCLTENDNSITTNESPMRKNYIAIKCAENLNSKDKSLAQRFNEFNKSGSISFLADCDTGIDTESYKLRPRFQYSTKENEDNSPKVIQLKKCIKFPEEGIFHPI